MKKYLIFSLCLTLFLSGCGSSNDASSFNSSLNDDSSSENSIINETSSENNANNNSSENNTEGYAKIDLSKVASIRPFSEGKTFIRLADETEYEKEYCIDQNGNILFDVDTKHGGNAIGFHNGIATFFGEHGTVYLCDEQGNITTPSDLGADAFLYEFYPKTDLELPFSDGYFFARKTETTFEGSVHKAAIFNYKFEKIVDFSVEVYNLYRKYFIENSCSYYKGYVYYTSEYDDYFFNAFNLKTGIETHDYQAVLESITLDHKSDFWEYDYFMGNYAYYDRLSDDDTPVIDLRQYTTVEQVGDFKDGTAYIVFYVRDEESSVYFFTILKEDGSFAFDPIQLDFDVRGVSYCNGTYLVENTINGNYATFNVNGKIAELKLQSSNDNRYYFSDDVIVLYNFVSSQVFFYDINFQPLF